MIELFKRKRPDGFDLYYLPGRALVGLVIYVLTGVGQLANADTQLEEIIVTAQKREQNMQDVPIAISTLSGKSLDAIRAGGADLRFLDGRVPSLRVESDFGRVFPRFYIRGLGNPDFDMNAQIPVSLVSDEVVLENPMLRGFPVFDIEQVEVLRGPQGSLFGRNTPAGIVKIDSVKPRQEFDGYVKLGVGRYDTVDVEAAVGGALSDRWSGRLSVLRQSRDDWVRNEPSIRVDPSLAAFDDDSFLEGYRDFALRVQLAYEGDDFSALFNIHGRDLDGTATVFYANAIQKGTNNLVPGFDREAVAFDGKNEQPVETIGGLVKLEWDVGAYTLTSITSFETVDAFSKADVDGGFGADFAQPSGPGFIPFPTHTGDGITDHHQFTQELRVSSNSENFSWQAGLYYFDENLEIESREFDFITDDEIGFARQEQDTESWAVFGQIDYDINEDLTLSAGLRFTRDKKDYEAERVTDLFGDPSLGPLPRVTTSPSDSQVSGNLALTYRFNDDVSVYGRFARGYRAPSIQGRVLFGDSVTVADSETIISIEAGVKSELFDRRLRLNATVYAFEVSDQQLTATSGSANISELVNADKTNGQGVEVEVEWAIFDDLLVTLGTSYNRTEIDDPNLTVAVCGGGCTPTDPAGPPTEFGESTVFVDGNDLPLAPEWITNATLRYGIPTTSGEFYVFTDWAFRGEMNFYLYESLEFQGDSLLLGGLRLGYASANGRYDISAYGRNITDEVQPIFSVDFNNLAAIVNDPRTWGVELTVNFN